MTFKPIYEFLLWNNCNNNCKFCFQRKDPKLYNLLERENILKKTIQFLRSDKYQKSSHVLICGGQIFDDISNKKILSNFFQEIILLLLNNDIDLLYINTNLIYENTDMLYDFLNLIQKNCLFNRLKFTTSYDLEGRFKNQNSKNIMLTNLLNLKKYYSNINIVTNIILTNITCKHIINNTFNVKNFIEKYNCDVNLIPYIIYNNSLTASRKDIFKTIKIVGSQIPGFLEKYIYNISIQQQRKLYIYKNNKFQYASCKMSQCGHSINFKRYSSNNTCFCCDLKELFNG